MRERPAELDRANAKLIAEVHERTRAEEKVRVSLREKEILLKEIHHRVKNNLQIISSLLELQSQSLNDEQSLRYFQESQNRIKTMALVHERLYASADLASINVHEYWKPYLASCKLLPGRSATPCPGSDYRRVYHGH